MSINNNTAMESEITLGLAKKNEDNDIDEYKKEPYARLPFYDKGDIIKVYIDQCK